MKYAKIILIIIMLLPTIAQADINTDMNSYFNSMGGYSNFTAPGAYSSQAGGHWTGGNVFVRTPVRNLQIASWSPMSITAGCGGIDAYLGGFSFINAAQFTAMLRSITANAQGYAFQLALQTFAPQIYATMNKVNEYMQQINNFSRNSCELAKGSVDGIAGKLWLSDEKECLESAVRRGLATDYADAYQYCGNGVQRETAKNDKADRDPVNVNVVYSGLDKSNYFAGDTALIETFMSLTGSVVIQTAGEAEPKIRYLPPLIDMDVLMDGYGNLATVPSIYDCAGDASNRCLIDQTAIKNIAITGALQDKVRAALIILRDNIDKPQGGDSVVSTADIGILVSTSLPVLRMMATAVALGGTIPSEMINLLVQPVTFDVASSYLSAVYKFVERNALESSYQSSVPSEITDQITTRIQALDKNLQDRINSAKTVQTAYQILQKAQFFDRLLMSQLTPEIKAAYDYTKKGIK
ncbi:MAG: conjugal transfer protein TraH [Mariprofundales bacterium]